MSGRTQARRDEAQCAGKEQLQASGCSPLRRRKYHRLNTSYQNAAISRNLYSRRRDYGEMTLSTRTETLILPRSAFA